MVIPGMGPMVISGIDPIVMSGIGGDVVAGEGEAARALPGKTASAAKLGCDARPSEDQTPEAGVFGAKTHLVSVVPAL
jgi:hypothetical protein